MGWDFDKNKPIYLQLVEILKFKIVSGELNISTKLKSVREMAEEADVNPNTMQRALAELEREGLVFTQRTSGRFVTDNEEMVRNMRKEVANKEINSLKEMLFKLGYSEDEMIDLITVNIKEV
ncbi:GntR family transcriptional regulator [Clostridium cylindrosporum]|uniref:Bacterial regulatory protein GntR family n=1 Tax=Clostridium cylindrosporum DSM 605 TaxID=1121307 RepID=A0A0J8DF22_CLOCY|nr:GntR family transcriptional regulator [Clostridium cylindrosporum]KMT22768.1 bacterial regulatory protein GntR family [Clostridium cylindrosporum DSM 605]